MGFGKWRTKGTVIVNKQIDENAIEAYRTKITQLKEEINTIIEARDNLFSVYAKEKESREKELNEVIELKKDEINALYSEIETLKRQVKNLEIVRNSLSKETLDIMAINENKRKEIGQSQEAVNKLRDDNIEEARRLNVLDNTLKEQETFLILQEDILNRSKRSLLERENSLNERSKAVEVAEKKVLDTYDYLNIREVGLIKREDDLKIKEKEIDDIRDNIVLKEKELKEKIRSAEYKYEEGVKALNKSKTLEDKVKEQEHFNISKEISLSILENNLKELRKSIDIREKAL